MGRGLSGLANGVGDSPLAGLPGFGSGDGGAPLHHSLGISTTPYNIHIFTFSLLGIIIDIRATIQFSILKPLATDTIRSEKNIQFTMQSNTMLLLVSNFKKSFRPCSPLIQLSFQLGLLVSSCATLPRFFTAKEQAEQCYLGFVRCCSSTTKIPLRCFELNRCPIHFNELSVYNRICSKVSAEYHENGDELNVDIVDDIRGSEDQKLIENGPTTAQTIVTTLLLDSTVSDIPK